MRRLLPLLLAAALLTSCSGHMVRVESEPPGAVVRVDGAVRGVTPVEFTVPWRPIFTRDYNMRVSMPGYRPAVAKREAWYDPSPLRRRVRLWRYLLHPARILLYPLRAAGKIDHPPRDTFSFVLVPDHGPAGTWGPEDVP